MKNKLYIIRNSLYPKEDLGRIILDFNNDTGIIFPLESYEGMHSSLFLENWAERGITKVTGEEAWNYVHRRVCPPGRHNIDAILEYHGLKSYNASVILDHNKGYCDKDDFWFEEIGEIESDNLDKSP